MILAAVVYVLCDTSFTVLYNGSETFSLILIPSQVKTEQMEHLSQCFRNLADIDGDGRLVHDEFIVALHYVAIAKSGKPVPASLPPDVVPPSYRKQQKPLTTSESPAEKPPASLPRPTSRPPAGVTKVPAIQPPSSVTTKSQPQTAVSSSEPTAPAGSVDPFGMKPAVFETTPEPAQAPTVDAEKEAAAVGQSSVAAGSPPTTDIPASEATSSAIEPSSAVVNEGMFCC